MKRNGANVKFRGGDTDESRCRSRGPEEYLQKRSVGFISLAEAMGSAISSADVGGLEQGALLRHPKWLGERVCVPNLCPGGEG